MNGGITEMVQWGKAIDHAASEHVVLLFISCSTLCLVLCMQCLLCVYVCVCLADCCSHAKPAIM